MQTECCLILPRKIVDQILVHAHQHEDTETCGLVSKSGNNPARYYVVKNIAADPSVRFEMDPKEQIAAMKNMRDQGEKLLAIVHSHPASPPVPSAIDIAEIGYPDAYYIIVSLQSKNAPDIRAYRMVNAVMQPVVLDCT
ncbi:MAG: M67 family metallopeptidase [Gammaproteobacteria bacterium]|jgi:proteasome lid subunit RPN8/RPN11